MVDLNHLGFVIVEGFVLIFAATALLRLVEIWKGGRDLWQSLWSGLLLSAFACLSLLASAESLSFSAHWPLVLLAATVSGLLSGVLVCASLAGLQFWLETGFAPAETYQGSAMLATIVFLGVAGLLFQSLSRRKTEKPHIGTVFMLCLLNGSLGAALFWLFDHWGQVFVFEDSALPLALMVASVLILGLVFYGIWLFDITRAQQSRLLAFAQQASDQGPDGLLWSDLNGKILYCNSRASELLNYSREELNRRFLRDIDHNPGDLQGVTRRLTDDKGRWPKMFEGRVITKTGGTLTLALAANLVTQDRGAIIVTSLRGHTTAPAPDIPEGTATASETPTNLALVPEQQMDALTGLGDLAAFRQMSQQLADRMGERSLENAAVAVVDMNDMAHFNERRGYAMGDALLASYARILRQSLRGADTAYRIDDDSFAVLMPGRGEGAFDSLLKRFAGVMRSVQDAGFPEAGATVGFAAFTEANHDPEATMALATERLLQRKPSSLRARNQRRTRMPEEAMTE